MTPPTVNAALVYVLGLLGGWGVHSILVARARRRRRTIVYRLREDGVFPPIGDEDLLTDLDRHVLRQLLAEGFVETVADKDLVPGTRTMRRLRWRLK